MGGLRASGLGAHLHTLGQGIGYTSHGSRRKGSGEGLDVLRDFKVRPIPSSSLLLRRGYKGGATGQLQVES